MPVPSDAPKPSDNHLVAIFEATNDTLREAYLGITTKQIEALALEFLRSPPKVISHWLKEHRVSYRCLEDSMAADEALSFIDQYVKSSGLKGWKILR